ncbi:MAG: ABC-F family ATP-binding cassette domain-containing protein [Deltaproteobacteria bacterium]|nr:ABC-F family ATP-binding cassette domain-containing protein [Deltaproteobacteria bacterium]MBN2672541.1 ABC-F family ATP-binding cassette domain-containing protein [Deltaproteobacteria bacterium]
MLQINEINYFIGGREIFAKASARVPKGKRVGLVGENGCGKTTLLRLITGELELDSGRIDVQKKCVVGTVAQDAPAGNATPLETVLAADVERMGLLQASATETDHEKIAYIHERLTDIDAHSAPSRAATILAGLGFSEEMQQRPLSQFSGGWRMRVALAGALFAEPDLLLLDEPTNHLDLESIMWLENYLRQYPHTLLVVSHDRDMLNAIVDNILLVKQGTLTMYSGNFDAYVKAEAEKEALEKATAAKQEAARAHLQSFVDRFKAKATKAKQAQSRMKALEKMGPVTRTTSSGMHIHFRFPAPVDHPSPLIKLDAVHAGYVPGQPVLSDLNLSVYKDDRIALLGANGNGKSTLAKLLSNNLSPMSGALVPAQKLVVGYFAQDHLDQLDAGITALEQVDRAMPLASPNEVRSWLGRFGFGQERAEVQVQNLSGGEKTRLALSLVALQRPNLMILDEPTNHLDMDSRSALVEGLNEFDGAIILISHDRRLIETTCEQLWLVENGACTQYFGDIDDYRKLLLSNRGGGSKSEELEDNKEKVSKKDARRDAAQNRARLAPLKKAAQVAENQVETLTAEKADLQEQLADPSIYEGPPETIASLNARLKEVTEALDIAEEEWLVTLDELESAMVE